MRKYVLPIMFAAGIWACGGSATADSSGSSSASAAPANDGAKIYKTYCVTCHGLYGDMGASGAFNLQTTQLTLEERVQVITNGRNAMTPFANLLTPEQIQAVAEYTLTLKK